MVKAVETLQTFCPHFAAYDTRRPSRLIVFYDPAKDYHLAIYEILDHWTNVFVRFPSLHADWCY